MLANTRWFLRVGFVIIIVLLIFSSFVFASETYIVKKGDTLYTIGKKFGIPVSTLKQTNHLRSNAIKPGQILNIPGKLPPKLSLSPSAGACGRVICDSVEVISSGHIIARLPKDTRLAVVGREDKNFLVKLSDGRIGSVEASGIQLEEIPRIELRSELYNFRHNIVRTALSYRGTRYRRGGVSAKGFDCSGFVKFVYSTEGVTLPHSSRSLYKYGVPVQKSELQPGDILFFSNTYRRGISHVGLYIGEGKFIHASTRRGGVRVDDLEAWYYRRHYTGARRIYYTPHNIKM